MRHRAGARRGGLPGGLARRRPCSCSNPPGSYPVGRITYDWVDPARDEAFAGHPTEERELMVLAWYPAARPGTATALALEDKQHG
ncbi:MAG: hypothetical protein AB8I80_25540 [Anaerolineae bacterium]